MHYLCASNHGPFCNNGEKKTVFISYRLTPQSKNIHTRKKWSFCAKRTSNNTQTKADIRFSSQCDVEDSLVHPVHKKHPGPELIPSFIADSPLQPWFSCLYDNNKSIYFPKYLYPIHTSPHHLALYSFLKINLRKSIIFLAEHLFWISEQTGGVQIAKNQGEPFEAAGNQCGNMDCMQMWSATCPP